MEAALVGSMAATLVGAGISAYGSMTQAAAAQQQGQYQAGMYTYQAGVATQYAQAQDTQAKLALASGEVEAQQQGLVSRAGIGRETVEGAAGSLDPYSGSGAGVRTSQIAIGQENEQLARVKAADIAYGDEVQAASYRAQAGADVTAAKEAVIAGGVAATGYDIGAAGSVVSGLGSVAGKWYSYSTTAGKTTLGA